MSLLNAVDEFMSRASGNVWFRGQSHIDQDLNSGLFRLQLPSLRQYLTLERELYQYYQSLGYLLHNGLSGWDLMYSMQHHGVKTRLLDWTESFSVAVYFALRHWRRPSACIWMLDPVKLNVLSTGQHKIFLPQECRPYPEEYEADEKIGTVAVYPVRNTKRINMQHGIFTIQGNGLCPLDQEFGGSLVKEGYLKKIAMSADVRQDAMKFIKLNGVNHFYLFPDLDGLAVYLNQVMQQSVD